MRTSLHVFLIATVMVANTAAAQTDGRQGAVGSTTDALIAHLPLDGSIVDKVSGVTPTVLVGTGPTEGKIDGAVQFDGSSFVQLPIDVGPEALPELTITMWVKPDRLPDDPELRKAFYPNAYLLSDGNGLLTIGDQQKDIPYYSAYSIGASIHNSDHPGMRGGWQLLAITRKIEDRTTDDGNVRPHTVLTLYSNGRVTEKSGIRTEKVITPNLNLGANSKGSSGKFRGAIDDIRVYARALSPDEIRSATTPSTGQSSVAGRYPGEATQGGEVSEETTFTVDGPLEVGIDAQSVQPAPTSEAGEASIDDLVLGSENSSSQKPLDSLGQPPSAADIVGDYADQEAQREAIENAAIDARPLAGTATAPTVGSAGNNVPADFEAPLLVTDQRADADPRAGVDAIKASNPGVTTPVSTADETEELIASEEGQAMLQSADWRIEGMVPNSADKTELYPGDEVTVKIRVSKDDPANKIPDVRLVSNVGPGTPSPSLDLTINTAAGKPTDERDVPITLPVPANLQFEEGATQLVWRPRVWLNRQDGTPLRDSIVDNHSRDVALIVMKPAGDDQCSKSVDNADGTTTALECLASEIGLNRPHVDLSTATQTKILVDNRIGEAVPDEFVSVMQFGGRGSVLGFIKLGERSDKACELVIDDAWRDAHEPGQKLNKCNSEARDYEEFRIPGGWGVVAMQICSSDISNVLTGGNTLRIKGVRVQTRQILPSGELGSEAGTEELEYRNCNAKWTETVACPAGHVAAGVRAVFDSGGKLASRDFLKGLGLICANPLGWMTT